MMKSVRFGVETTNPLASINSARMDIEKQVQRLTDGMSITRGGVIRDNDDSSIGKTDNSDVKVDNKVFGSYQWYQRNPDLYRAEVENMKETFPEAKEGRLEDGRMTWTVTIPNIADVPGNDWTFMMIYDSDHPANTANEGSTIYERRWAGSIKVYPTRPNVGEIMEAATRAGRGGVPHLLQDNYNNYYLCSFLPEEFQAGRIVTNAVGALCQSIRWAIAYSTGLKSQRVWDRFCQHTDQF